MSQGTMEEKHNTAELLILWSREKKKKFLLKAIFLPLILSALQVLDAAACIQVILSLCINPI